MYSSMEAISSIYKLRFKATNLEYIYIYIRLSDDKSNLDIVGTSITVTKAGLPARRYTFPLEKPLVMDNKIGPKGLPKTSFRRD